MAVTVEDGSVVPNADSYASVEDADAYFTARGVTAWAGDAATKEAALRKATDYLDAKYGARLTGYRKDSSQPLKWPRRLVPIDDIAYGSEEYWADNVVPPAIKKATFECAVRSLTAELAPDLERGGAVASVSVAGAVTKSFFQSATPGTTFPVVDRLMRDFTYGSRGITLERS